VGDAPLRGKRDYLLHKITQKTDPNDATTGAASSEAGMEPREV